MPTDAIMFNPRLTGQAKQLWAWLASMEYRRIDMSWTQCEYKLNCGPTARRRCLMQLRDEGFVSLSDDGTIVTMHDPVKVHENARRIALQEICKECQGFTQPIKIDTAVADEIKETPAIKKVDTSNDINEKQLIVEYWNKCKPDCFSKIRNASDKQTQAILKHIKNLGLTKKDIPEFICSVCNGLNLSNFWLKKVNPQTKNFNAVFGYGSPTDTKMKNVEQLYTDGDSQHDINTSPVRIYTPEQQELLDEIEVHDYEIDTSFNDEERRQRSMRGKEKAIEKLKALGISLEQN